MKLTAPLHLAAILLLASLPSRAAGAPAPADSSGPPSPLALRGNGRPHPVGALWDAAGAYGSDMVYLYTSPLRMNAGNALWVGGVAAVGAVLYAHDQQIHEAFVRSRENPVYDVAVDKAGGFFAPLGLISRTNLWLGGAAVAGWVFDVPLLRTIPGEILESNSIVGIARQPIEQVVGRRRPNERQGPRSFSGGRSFPSGHASVVCETAAILSHHARQNWARAAIWTVAGLVCLERVEDPRLDHWPSDVWFGAALGTWAGHTIAMRNEERRQNIPQARWFEIMHRPTGRLSATPMVAPDGFGFVVRAVY